MNWGLIIDPHARKQLRRIPKNEARKLTEGIEELRSDPYAGDIEKVGGEKDTWRRRIGSYRVLYGIYQNQKLIHIFDITRKTTTTYRKR